MERLITIDLNDRPQELRVAAQATLLEVLREQAGLTGTKEGCGVGACGACTVLVDGRPISSCLYLAVWADGASVTTVEGLSAEGRLSPVQAAFVEEGASQCGFCTPGMVVTTTALLQEHPHCTQARAREHLAGNLCRCGCYYQILSAIDRLAAPAKDQP